MVSIQTARQLALSLPMTEEKSHFEQPDFRIKNKIFASLHPSNKRMMVKLSLLDQSVFCLIDPAIIFPVPGGWGKKGNTFIELQLVKKTILKDALTCAWKNTAPTSMVSKFYSSKH